MAQPNLAREPSMDEILASIRKIIENNEFGTPVVTDGHDVLDDEDDIRLTVEDDLTDFAASPIQDDMPKEAYFYEPAQRMVAAEPAAQTATPKSMSLADVAARVRAASEQRISQAISGTEPVMPSPARAAEPPVVDLRVPSSIAADTKASPAQGRGLAVSGEKEQTPIMSPDVGEKVSRAFESLSAAVDIEQRRSFDDIAEEMMRPMLQDWLDDNLPKLVERLVREEIERVARGPRR
jgi:uncharacterized protein